jgi:hypothetical protein
MAETIPSPNVDHMIEGVTNPAQLTRRIIEHRGKERPSVPTSVRPTDAPAAPDITELIRKGAK